MLQQPVVRPANFYQTKGQGMSGQGTLDNKQAELFALKEVQVAKSCQECVYHHQNPYDRCHKFGDALLRILKPCSYFLFAKDFNALLGSKDTDMDVLINNKMKEIL